MSAQRVTITYTAPSAFLSTEHWQQVHAALLSQLPLRNLHWKSASRPAIRTIQELAVNFVPADSIRDEHTSQVPQSLLERPLLNVYIVICEDSETYKNTVKKQIKDWHSAAIQRKNQEWLIIHIVRPDNKATGGRIFQMKASVLDKIKADFNVEKRDRCVQLVWSSDYDNPTAWADLINKVKDGILSAFDSVVVQREEEVKRSEGQRQMPGWNYCTFFILKESLAYAFEGMSLYEDALEDYNELEELFFQVLKDKSLFWFGPLITPSPADDSSPLLSVTHKSYRDLILANTISIFDFRVYLLARQCTFLSKMGKIVEIAKKAVSFLGIFGKRLREVENTLPTFFLESWTYCSALSVVEQCETWAARLELNKATSSTFNAVKGELVELARTQLDILGVRMGYLPSKPPFSIALPSYKVPDIDPASLKASQTISKPELLASLDDRNAFYELYVSITNRAIELYASAGRRKFALKMHGSLAALDVVRDRLSNALQTYTSLPAHYIPHGWTSLEAYMLSQALDIHSATDKPKDRDWIHLVLEFLKAYVQDLGKELLMADEDKTVYVARLVASLKNAAQEAQSDFNHVDHPAISVAVKTGDARLAETRDGALLDLVVRNTLPCEILIDEVIVVLSGREGIRMSFSEKVESLSPGVNNITVFSPSATAGTYSLHSSRIRLSRLNLQWTHSSAASGKANRTLQPPTLVRVPKDVRALDVRLRQPQRIEIGTPSKVIVVLHTGRNHISKATLKLSAPSGIRFDTKTATVHDNQDLGFEGREDSLVFSDVPQDEKVIVSVPHSDASSFHAMRVNILCEYDTISEPGVPRTLQSARVVLTALPVAINVEDFFRGTRLFTRFTLSSTSHQHVRIRSTELRSLNTEGDNALKITKSIPQTHSIVVSDLWLNAPHLLNAAYKNVTPEQPGKFLFQLDSARGPDRGPLHLHISYRMLREEVESFIDQAVTEVLSSSPQLRPLREILVDKLVQSLERDAGWVDLYGLTGDLVVPDMRGEEGEVGEAISQVKEVMGKGRNSEQSSIGEWREIVIPVDVPQMHIVAAARLRILPNPFSNEIPTERLPPLFAGQPISALLTITTSFHWAPTDDTTDDSYQMRFDIEEMTQDWLVSGPKRGDFIAKDGQKFTTSITLIALHHGELPLPQVAVSALPLPGRGRMKSVVVPSCEAHQIHGAETVLVLPRGGRSTFVIDMGDAAPRR